MHNPAIYPEVVRRVTERRGPAQRQPGNGAQVIFELARDRSFDGPVTGVVHARRDFIGDQTTVLDEKLDREDAHIIKFP